MFALTETVHCSFVCATSSHGGATCIRSYRNREAHDDLLEDCKVWQAARATSGKSLEAMHTYPQDIQSEFILIIVHSGFYVLSPRRYWLENVS